jgi:hypothetical protein
MEKMEAESLAELVRMAAELGMPRRRKTCTKVQLPKVQLVPRKRAWFSFVRERF